MPGLPLGPGSTALGLVASASVSPWLARYRVPNAIEVAAWHIDEMAHGRPGITADTAVGLLRVPGLTDRFFIDVHAHDDAGVAREQL